MQVGDIITDKHSGGEWRYRITSMRDGGKNGLPVIRRYVGEAVKKDGTTDGTQYNLDWLNNIVTA